MWFALTLIKNVLTQLAKNVLVPLALIAAAADAAIQKKVLGLRTTALIISYEEMNDIMKIVKFPKKSG